MGWTDNPAWIYYDIVVSDRFGLGNRLTSANIFEMDAVPDRTILRSDGSRWRGGDGMEPRYTL